MSLVFDFHVHVFNDALKKIIPRSILYERLNDFRKKGRTWIKPLSSTIHKLQTSLRYLPDTARNQIDQLAAIIPLPSLLVESTLSDLKDAMWDANIDYAMVIAHPPIISNEFILEICSKEPHLIPAVNIPKGTIKPGNILKKYVKKGAKALKIHPSADGEGSDSLRYRALIRTASDLGLPIILHTGCMHARLIHKSPLQAHAERFITWYEKYPKTQFILAHMNFHEPHAAIDLCEKFPNLWVDTSWQPPEVIGEAVRRIGAERVLFGTDWPLLGNNMVVGRKRIRDCLDIGLLNDHQAQLILGENAIQLLGLSKDAY